MENFNNTNIEVQNEGTIGKAIVFAIIGMLVGIIPYLIIGGVLDMRGWWIGAASVGGAISVGWHLGNGKSGVTRQVTIIILSIIGAIITIHLGYAIAIYRIGIGADFMAALDWTIDLFFDGLDVMFDNFGSIFGNDHLEAMIAWDTLLAIGVAIAVAWKRFNPSAGNEDLEELDNDLEDINTDNVPSANTEMDDVLNQDVPTLDVDQNWDCASCGATNRDIVDTCEYCGESK